MSLAATVAGLMGHEGELLVQLRELLTAEHAALLKRDGVTLQGLSEKKQQLIGKLEAAAGQRARMLTERGLPTDGSGVTALLAQLEPGARGQAEAQWEAIRENLEACHKQNQVNGRLLESSLRTSHELLAILLGHSRESNTYNRQGSLDTTLNGRNYAKA